MTQIVLWITRKEGSFEMRKTPATLLTGRLAPGRKLLTSQALFNAQKANKVAAFRQKWQVATGGGREAVSPTGENRRN